MLLGTVSVPHQGRGAVVVRGIGAVRHAVDGILGFIDDFAKVRKKQSEGLTVKGKFIGQFILATIYAVLALILPTKSGFPSAQAGMSFIEKPFFGFEFAGRVVAIVLFVIWVNFRDTAWTNAINLTDGLDGLAAGSSMIAFIGYAIIAFWEFYHLKVRTIQASPMRCPILLT